MRRMTAFAALLLLAACGGGGNNFVSAPAPPASSSGQSLPLMQGTVTVDSVELLTASPTASTPLLFRVRATAVGTVPSGASGFDLRLALNRVDGLDVAANGTAEGIIVFGLTSGTPISGTWTGTALITLQPQSAGPHTFAAVADPSGTFDFTGSWSSAATGSVLVGP